MLILNLGDNTAIARGDIATAQLVRLQLHEEGVAIAAVRDFDPSQADRFVACDD